MPSLTKEEDEVLRKCGERLSGLATDLARPYVARAWLHVTPEEAQLLSRISDNQPGFWWGYGLKVIRP